MRASFKFIIGLVVVLLLAWISHGPLGNGAAIVDGLEAEARTAVAAAEVPGVDVSLSRDPLSRRATLAGPANNFQREGMGEFPGLTDRVGAIDGISGVQWADQGDLSAGMPLLLETMLLLLAAYLIGLALAWLLFGRAKKEGYL